MKIALLKDNKDVIRIIPSLKPDHSIEFKFSLLNNIFQVRYWHLGKNTPERHFTSAELTYHSSKPKEDKCPIVHIKEENSELKYIHPFSKIMDIKSNTIFPAPLCKVTVKDGFSKAYKPKHNHIPFDFDTVNYSKFNTVEIYIVSKSYDETFMYKWPSYDVLWQSTSIDYLTSGPKISVPFLEKLYSGPNLSHMMSTSIREFNVLFKPYYDKNVQCNSISFYENYDYVSFLATTPTQLIDGISKKPLSPIAPAFAFDLEWQLDHGESRNQLDKWKEYFDNMLFRANSCNIHKHIFQIPQFKR